MAITESVHVSREPVALTASPQASATSWGAIVGGALASAALSLILLSLGTGLGLSSISPWAYEGASATSLAIGTIVWLLLMAGLASGLGGYVAGRLRAQWPDVDGDEAFFRDTAHGFLTWALATIATAALLTSAASSMVGTAAKAGATAATAVGATAMGGAAASANGSETTRNYFVDMMFRGAKPADPNVARPADANADTAATRREAGGILANALSGQMPQGDRTYLAQLVANRTGLSQPEAEQRVDQTTAAAKAAADQAAVKAKEAADTARKATAYTALWVFVSLLFGAFSASLAATWGGRQRDLTSYTRRLP